MTELFTKATWQQRLKQIDRANRARVRRFGDPDGTLRVRGRRMQLAMRFDFETRIENLFDLLTNLERAAAVYVPVGVRHLRDADVGTDRFGVGSERGFEPLPGVIYRERILVKQPPHRMEWTFICGAPIGKHRGVLAFEPLAPNRARMTQTVDLEFQRPIPALLAPLLARGIWQGNVQAFMRVQSVVRLLPEVLESLDPSWLLVE